MTATAVLILQVLSCFGWGGLVLRFLGLQPLLSGTERWGWAFAIGLGVIGWLNFWLALFSLANSVAFGLVLALGAFGCLTLPFTLPSTRPKGWQWLLVGILFVAMIFDLAEALAPPADADTLAYHFARPKEILQLGHLIPVARAVDGATPLLLQMSYLSVLSMGGESALTLWTGLGGWLALLPLFAIARRWLPTDWAAACVIVVATVPAWVYGAGSGQVEARLAAFALTALVAMASALQTRRPAWALLAGLLVGFFAGAKFFGLPFAALCGTTLLLARQWRNGLVFGFAAVLAGGQWYIWHWIQLGDPLFPLLWSWFHSANWDQMHATTLKEIYFASETAVPASPFWALAYPLVATLAPFPIWEAGRTGMGPYALLMSPFAALGCWHFRRKLPGHTLFWLALLGLGFYGLWFFSGTSQRIRHLLPLFPVLVLCLTVAAHRWASTVQSHRPIVLGMVLVSCLQLGGHALFATAYLQRLWRGETRDEFLGRTVINYAPVPWINTHLGRSDRLLLSERQLIYFIDIPVFFGHEYFQAELNLLPNAEDDIDSRITELRELGISHILYEPGTMAGLSRLLVRLDKSGCIEPEATFTGRLFYSRTLGLGAMDTRFSLVRIKPECGKNSG